MKVAGTKTAASAQHLPAKSDERKQPFFQRDKAGSVLENGQPSLFFPNGSDGIQRMPFFARPTVQPKLRIGSPLQRKPVFESESAPEVQAKALNGHTRHAPQIQRKCDECEPEQELQKMEDSGEEEALQKKPVFDSAASPPEDNSLPHQVEFERTFGEDFGDVEVRLGDARGSGHGAFATFEGGQDVLAFDETSPSSEQIAHELVHVAQRRRFGEGGNGLASSEVPSEIEARDLAPRAAAGQPVDVRATPAQRIQRDDDVAQRINDNLHGWVMDDEKAALRELRGDRDRAGTCRTYQIRFGYSLWGDFIDNASGDTLHQALALLWPHMTLLQRLDTMTGVDDDEAGILQTITNASDAEVKAARGGIQRYLDELDPADQYTARRRIWPEPEEAIPNVVWLLGAGHGWIWDDEGPVATAILSLTPDQRKHLWTDNPNSFGMFNKADRDRIGKMCITEKGTPTTDAGALKARMELATEGAGTDEQGVMAAVAIAGNRRDELARIQQQLDSGLAPDRTPLTPKQRADKERRKAEIGDVEGLLTPKTGADAALDPNSFLGRVQDDMDAATVEAAMVTAHADAFARAKQALLGTADWTGNVDEEAVLRILREVTGNVTLAEGETIEGLGEAEVKRRRAEATAAIRLKLRTDEDLKSIWSALDVDEYFLAVKLTYGSTYLVALDDLGEAFHAINTDEGRILRVLHDASAEDRKRMRTENPEIIREIRDWAAGGEFLPLFNTILETGVIPPEAAIAYGGAGLGTDEEMITDVLNRLTSAERAQLRRGYLLDHTRGTESGSVNAPLTPSDQAALARYQALHAQLSDELGDEDLDNALAAMLDIPTTAEVLGTDAQGRLDAAAIMLFRQRQRLQLSGGLTDIFTTTDNTAAAAHIEFEARYNQTLEDGDITPDEFAVLVRLDTVFNERFAEYSATANAVSEIAGTVAAVVVATVVIILSEGAGTPAVIAWLNAHSTLIAPAAFSAIAQVGVSEVMGGDFNDMLSEEGARQALSGALNGALAVCGAALAERAATLVGLSGRPLTAAIARAAADSVEVSVAGRAFARGTLTGLIDGFLGGAVGELAMTLSDAKTWRHTVWEVIGRAGESLLRGGVLGGLTGAGTGGALEMAQGLRAKGYMRGVEVSLDDALGTRVHIDYSLNPDGSIKKLALHFGPGTLDPDLAAHVDRIISIKRASSLLSRAHAAISGNTPLPAGTVSGDAAHEVAKIKDMIADRLRQLRNELSAADRQVVEGELDVLESNLNSFSKLATSGDLSPGTGRIARPDAPPGFPDPPEGHYYRRRGDSWDLQRYPDSNAPPHTLQRNKSGGWEIVTRDGAAATPAAKFPEGTTPEEAFDLLTGSDSTSSFRAYWEMLRDNGLATREDIIAQMLNPSGRPVDTVRHGLKGTFESRVFARAERTVEGAVRTEAQSLLEMKRLTANLNQSDRGNMLEKWYAHRRPGLVPHARMTNADNPGLVVGRGGRGERTPDFVEGRTLVEMKSTSAGMNAEDVAQIEDGLRVSAAGGVVRMSDGTTRVLDSMRLVFTDIRGARGSADQLAEWISDYPKLTIEVFDSSGAARSINKATLPGFLQRHGVATLQELLKVM